MSENPSNLDRASSWVRQSLTIKLLSIGFLILIMLIPTMLIHNLIKEREYRRNTTVREISDTWGNAQTISGPVLTIPYKKYMITENEDGKTKKTVYTKNAHFLPNKLNIESNVSPEIRYRGIYEAILYNTQLQITGNFSSPDFGALAIEDENVMWEDAFIAMGITDMRGIQESIELDWDSTKYLFDPGVPIADIFGSGVSVGLPLKENTSAEKSSHTFSMNININGSGSLNFLPLGKETTLAMESNWGSPSFSGAFLPDERNITPEQFTANWKVLHLNRNYPQQWVGKAHSIDQSKFGLSLLMPLDQYQKNERSVKYAIMFICLTFLLFFFVEILNTTRIHPLQYLLVGLSICVFYLLLLSFSEQIGFNNAYFIASAGVILLITIYSKSVLKNNMLTLVMFGTLVGLYGFLYSLLQLQDYALLMGSVGLFVILAVVMYLSRNIDWYTIGKRQK